MSSAFVSGLGITLAVSIVVFLVAWLVGLRLGRFNVVDAVWGLSFVVIAVVSLLWAQGHDADRARQILALVMTAVWGLRLSIYIGWRSRGKGEDPRYDAMLARASGSRARYALVHVFLLQAGIAWFISFPVQASMFERPSLGPLAFVGVAVWAVGIFFESVGDAQLARFRADPANKGQVMDRGLWRYTRHPNYFGDACVWVGLYLVAAATWAGAATILSPVAMGWFLSMKTGKPLLEKSMAKTKPGYADYVRRTSGFFPLPPRKA